MNVPAYLISTDECVRLACGNDCANRFKQAADGRWFITMGHAGYNSPANNGDGYASEKAAAAAHNRYRNRAARRGGIPAVPDDMRATVTVRARYSDETFVGKLVFGGPNYFTVSVDGVSRDFRRSAYGYETAPKKFVLWKDEGGVGPVYLMDTDPNIPQPFVFRASAPRENPEPWMTLADAEKYAKRIGAEFRQG